MGPYYCHTNVAYLGPDPKEEKVEEAFTAGFNYHEEASGSREEAELACPYRRTWSDHENRCWKAWMEGWQCARNSMLNSSD